MIDYKENNQVTSTLNILNSVVEDGGLYNCIAVNSEGTVEHFERINIYGI